MIDHQSWCTVTTNQMCICRKPVEKKPVYALSAKDSIFIFFITLILMADLCIFGWAFSVPHWPLWALALSVVGYVTMICKLEADQRRKL